MTASFEGHVEVVRALIVSQALVNTQNEVCVCIIIIVTLIIGNIA